MKNLIITLILICTIPLCTSCAIKDNTTNPQTTNTIYGMTSTPMQDFELVAAYNEFPVMYEDAGKFGYKDKDGNIVIQAQFDKANEFNQNDKRPYTSAAYVNIINGEETYDWRNISPTGNITKYNYIDSFYSDNQLVTTAGTADLRYVLLNRNLEEVLLNDYELITMSTKDSGEIVTIYGIEDDEIVEFDLESKLIISYEKAITGEIYDTTVDITDYDIAIINNQVFIDSKYDDDGATFPFGLIPTIEFDFYIDDGVTKNLKGSLKSTGYTNQLGLYFEGESGDYVSEDICYAVPSYKEIDMPTINPEVSDSDREIINQVIEDYLVGNLALNTPYEIQDIIIMDFQNNSKQGALVVVRTNENEQKIMEETSTEDQYNEAEVAILSAVLYIPDMLNSDKYEILDSSLYQTSSKGSKNHKIITPIIGNDGIYDVILEIIYPLEGGSRLEIIDLP